MNEQLIKKEQLANGMVLSVYDKSRKIAGDRWFVKIDCVASIPLPQDAIARKLDTLELRECIQNEFGGNLVFSVSKERNFISADDKDLIIAQSVSQVFDNMAGYINNQKFKQRLFDIKYKDAKNHCLHQAAIRKAEEEKNIEEPADFSACFKN